MRLQAIGKTFTYEYIYKTADDKDKTVKFNLNKLDMDVKPEQINAVAEALETLFIGRRTDVLVIDSNRYFAD